MLLWSGSLKYLQKLCFFFNYFTCFSKCLSIILIHILHSFDVHYNICSFDILTLANKLKLISTNISKYSTFGNWVNVLKTEVQSCMIVLHQFLYSIVIIRWMLYKTKLVFVVSTNKVIENIHSYTFKNTTQNWNVYYAANTHSLVQLLIILRSNNIYIYVFIYRLKYTEHLKKIIKQ